MNFQWLFWKNIIMNESRTRYNSLVMTEWLAKKLWGEKLLSERLKLLLTLFSNLDRKTTVHADIRNKGADVSVDQDNIYKNFDWRPFKRLPDARKFTIVIKGLDWLFALFGFKKNWKPRLQFEVYKNKRYNRYSMQVLKKLDSYIKAGNYVGYWRLVDYILKHSKVFFVMGLRKVNLNWHRNMKYSDVIKLYKKVKGIALRESFRIDYKRVYIDKSSTKGRPLGVPTLAWRVYLGLLNDFLYLGIRDKIPASQHGFQMGKGTLTAWKEFFELAVHKRNIYEFDLEKFFDTVDLKALCKVLNTKYQVPLRVCGQLLLLNSHIPYGMVFVNSWEISTCVKAQVVKLMMKYTGAIPEDKDVMKFCLASEHDYLLNTFRVSLDKLADFVNWKEYKLCGVAQGAPTSPLLSIVALNETLFKLPISVSMYADDGYFYTDDDDFTPPTRELGYGVRMNWEKSAWVKRSGVWLKPFKFLGLSFDGKENLLRAATRNGSELIYSWSQLVTLVRLRLLLMSESPDRNNDKPGSFQEMVHSTAWGLIQSRLYNGSLNLDGLEQDFANVFRIGSWVWRPWNRSLNIFISSSFACHSLIRRLSRLPTQRKQNFSIHIWEEYIVRACLHRNLKDCFRSPKSGAFWYQELRDLPHPNFKNWEDLKEMDYDPNMPEYFLNRPDFWPYRDFRNSVYNVEIPRGHRITRLTKAASSV